MGPLRNGLRCVRINPSVPCASQDAAQVSARTTLAAQSGKGSAMWTRGWLIGIVWIGVFFACVASLEGR